MSNSVMSCQNLTGKNDFAKSLEADGVVEWSARRTRSPAVLGSSRSFVLGSFEFKSSATLVNSQLVASCQLGFLILLCCI